MIRSTPALELDFPAAAHGLTDLVSATLDDLAPSAVHETGSDEEPAWRVFFASAAARDEAREVLTRAHPSLMVAPVDVPDEDWAARSQASLRAVRVGRIIVAPPWDVPPVANEFAPVTPLAPPAPPAPLAPLAPLALPAPPAPLGPPAPVDLVLVIHPSMAFGTAHHETTRLCLGLLQELDCRGLRVLDVGTGSGVLALAAARLGAQAVEGIDFDPDAIACARENVGLNDVWLARGQVQGATPVQVRFDVADVRTRRAPADLVLANLTGGLLVASAQHLLALTRPGGSLILSGFQPHEADDVLAAFAAGATVVTRTGEGEWEAVLLGVPYPTGVGPPS